MPKFRDKLGRDWEVEITRDLLPGLRAAGLDMGTLPKNPEQLAVLDDPDGFGRVLWVLCGEQAGAKGLDEAAFARGFNGEAVGAACDAITEAVSDFIHRRPAAARAAREELPRILTAADRRAERRIREAADRAIAEMETPAPSGSTNSATNSAGSAASTPGGSPSGG